MAESNPFDEVGPLDDYCQCCAGKLKRGDTVDPMVLCDDCLEAALEGGCGHLSAGPADDFEALAAEPHHVVRVEPVMHRRGRAWHWRIAVASDAAGCTLCRPLIPCWRHTTPALDLVDCRFADAQPIHIYACTLGDHRRAADVACTGDGGIAVEPFKGEFVASVCEPCAIAHVGRQVEAVTHG